MNSLDKQYYIAFWALGPGIVYLKPDKVTAERFYSNTYQKPGRPLHFINGFREEMAKASNQEVITDVMFDGAFFMVNDPIYEALADFEIADLQFYPAVYESDSGRLYDYHFLIFHSGKSDWYDRNLSTYDRNDIEEERDKPDIEKYVLDANRMLAIPEEQRLMFCMRRVMCPAIFVHERAMNAILSKPHTGIRFFRVNEYEDGMESS